MKQQQITESKTAIIESYDSEDIQIYGMTSSSAQNGYAGSDSTTYAQVNISRGSSAKTYIYWKFAALEIPRTATISSVVIKAKASMSNVSSSYTSSKQMQAYVGTTAIGSATTLTGSSTEHTLNLGSRVWEASDFNDLRVRLYAKRTTSSVNSNIYFLFYGATVEVEYSYQGTVYTVTCKSELAPEVNIGPATQDVKQGGELIVVTSDKPEGVQLTDNGEDVTDQLVKAPNEELNATPKSYTTSGSISGTKYQQAVGKGADAAAVSGNDYASNSTAYITYSFDFSYLDETTEIKEVTLKVKGHCESTTQSSRQARLQAYSGTTAKGSYSDFTSTSDQVITMNIGSWTVDELHEAKLRFTIGYYGGAVSGATWTVKYGADGYQYILTNMDNDHTIILRLAKAGTGMWMRVNGEWVEADKVYIRENGIWKEIEGKDMPRNKLYVKQKV